MLGIGFDLAPQTADLIVDRSIENIPVPPVHEIEEARAREHHSGPFQKRDEHPQLGRREFDRLALLTAQHLPVHIENPAVAAQSASAEAACHRLGTGLASEDGGDARQQFTRVNGLAR